jgi:protein TonB
MREEVHMATADPGVRATSLLASAALLGVATLAALTMTISQAIFDPPNLIPTIEVVTEPPPAPPQPPQPQPQPIRNTVPQETAIITDTLPPLETEITTTDSGYAGPVVEGPVTISEPTWLRRPRDLARYYPRRAIAMEREGQVVLDCLVRTTGALQCQVISETPSGWGFGDAALAMARDHTMSPATRNGAVVEGRYRMRVPFELD